MRNVDKSYLTNLRLLISDNNLIKKQNNYIYNKWRGKKTEIISGYYIYGERRETEIISG